MSNPENVSILTNNDFVFISWEEVTGATSYKVYSSDEPYAGFTEDTSGSFVDENWSTPATNEKKFYYVKAVN